MTSKLETLMQTQILAHGLPAPTTEHEFYDGRKWRFDFAWPAECIALEVEGGTWNQGRHQTGAGFSADCEKYNMATLLGWRVLRVTGDQIKSGQAIQWLMQAIGEWQIENFNFDELARRAGA